MIRQTGLNLLSSLVLPLHPSQLVDLLSDLLLYVLFMLAESLNDLFHDAAQVARLKVQADSL